MHLLVKSLTTFETPHSTSMKKTKKIILYSITVFVIIFAIVWNYYIKQWQEAKPERIEEVVRVDTFVLWPLVITLVVLSLLALFRKKKE